MHVVVLCQFMIQHDSTTAVLQDNTPVQDREREQPLQPGSLNTHAPRSHVLDWLIASVVVDLMLLQIFPAVY